MTDRFEHYPEPRLYGPCSPDAVVNELVTISSLSHVDAKYAHAREDELHQWVLASIADGTCERPDVCASRALESTKIKFTR